MKSIQAITRARFSAVLKYFLVILPSVFAIAGSALANLGNGYEQIDDAYGNLIQRRLRDDGAVTVVYHKGRYLYEVTFANGRSVAESYFHVKGTDLSEKEIARFLKANAAGGTWTPVDATTKRRFKRSDGGAEAKYGDANGRRGLTVREVGAGF
jgi:hypothetical protein